MSSPLVGLPAVDAGPAPNPTAMQIVEGKQGTPEYDMGNGLLSTLSLPPKLHAWSTFTWDAHLRQMSDGNMNRSGMHQSQENPATLTQMTMAGAMSWLRDLAVNKPDDYNVIVRQLLLANYLTPAQAKYGGFTTDVANGFLRSAADVWNVNQGGGAGQLLKWGSHIDSMIKARIAAGQIDANGNPIGSGSAGPQAPTRKDNYTSPVDTRYAINQAAENILGRKLSDKEAAGFQSLFHGMEAKSNDQQWAQTMSAFNNQSSTPNTAPALTTPPSPTAAASDYMDHAGGALGQERTTQLLGSYVGILRSMTGLGAGGVAHAVN